jgi:hypothetical protein
MEGTAHVHYIVFERGRPHTIKTHKGSEFISKAMDKWPCENSCRSEHFPDNFLNTRIKKRLGNYAKSLITLVFLVGGASFELATPAV